MCDDRNATGGEDRGNKTGPMILCLSNCVRHENTTTYHLDFSRVLDTFEKSIYKKTWFSLESRL